MKSYINTVQSSSVLISGSETGTARVAVAPVSFPVECGPGLPSYNMGVENISSMENPSECIVPSENQIIIDFLQFTAKTVNPDEAIQTFGFQNIPFVENPHGGHGYKKSRRAGQITVYYDGAENMGVHIQLSGQGCRQFEGYNGKTHCWNQLLLLILAHGASTTRIDIAKDTIDGTFSLQRLESAILVGDVKSQFRSTRLVTGSDFKKTTGHTRYLGSSKSDIQIRFYDKALEKKVEGSWVRSEIQLRNEHARAAVIQLVRGVEIGAVFVGIINSYFTVINSESVNKCQCTIQSWWSSWLVTTEKIKLTTMKAIKLVDEVIEHIKKQYSASFAMIQKHVGYTDYFKLMRDMAREGYKRMTAKHEMILACSNLATELPF